MVTVTWLPFAIMKLNSNTFFSVIGTISHLLFPLPSGKEKGTGDILCQEMKNVLNFPKDWRYLFNQHVVNIQMVNLGNDKWECPETRQKEKLRITSSEPPGGG